MGSYRRRGWVQLREDRELFTGSFELALFCLLYALNLGDAGTAKKQLHDGLRLPQGCGVPCKRAAVPHIRGSVWRARSKAFEAPVYMGMHAAAGTRAARHVGC